MTKVLLYLIVVAFLSSCTIQKAYIVNPPNVNCFQYQKEKNLKAAINNKSLNVQTNMALNNKFGLSGSIYGGLGYLENKTFFYGAEIGGIYYKYFTNRAYFEIQGGYGFCMNKIETGWPTDIMSAIGLHGTSYDCESNTNYHKLYIQPTFFSIGKKINLGFAVKCNAVYFNKYYFTFDKELDDGDGEGSDGPSGRRGTCTFNDKYGFIFEPVINMKFGNVFFIQFVGAVSNNIQTGTAYEYFWGPQSYPREEFNFSNPQHTNFKINIGFEFKLGKDKKPIINE